MKGTRYDAAFKKEAISMVNELGLSVTAVSEKLGVHIKTLYRWLDEFRQDGNNAFPLSSPEIAFESYPLIR